MRAGRVFFLLCISLFWWGIVGISWGVILSEMVHQVDAQHRYREATGRVLESRIATHGGTHGPQYEPQVRFEYAVGARTFRSDRYSFDTHSYSSGRSYAQKVVDQHPPGKTIPVYYDPEHPERAVLNREIAPQSWFMILFLQPFTVIGFGWIWALVDSLSSRKRLRRFLDSPPEFPWKVPRWGVMTSVDGVWTIEYRPSRLLMIVVAYGLLSFLMSALLAFGGGSSANPSTLVIGLGTAVAVVAAVAVGLRIGSHLSRRLQLDPRARTVRIGSRTGEASIGFGQIERLQVRRELEIRRGQSRPGSMILEAMLEGGEDMTLHKFVETDEPDAVARKVGEQIGGVIGVPLKMA